VKKQLLFASAALLLSLTATPAAARGGSTVQSRIQLLLPQFQAIGRTAQANGITGDDVRQAISLVRAQVATGGITRDDVSAAVEAAQAAGITRSTVTTVVADVRSQVAVTGDIAAIRSDVAAAVEAARGVQRDTGALREVVRGVVFDALGALTNVPFSEQARREEQARSDIRRARAEARGAVAGDDQAAASGRLTLPNNA
jgi:hypothetical protein